MQHPTIKAVSLAVGGFGCLFFTDMPLMVIVEQEVKKMADMVNSLFIEVYSHRCSGWQVSFVNN
jgi:hypothetical protein